MRNTLEGGRRAGYLTATGAALANSLIAVGCAVGLAVMSPAVLDGIRIAGALFLGFLGAASLFRAWSSRDGGISLTLDPNALPRRLRAGAYFGDGLAINLLSPVIISYYLAVVPSFIPAGASRLYYSGLAATHVSLAWLCHSIWATALDFMRRWLVHPWRRRLLQAAMGLALIGLAIRIVI